MLGLKIMFAGLWPLIVDYAIPLTIVAAILAIEFFTAQIEATLPFLAGGLERVRKDLMWVAAVILICIAWGVHVQIDTNKRCLAQTSAVTQAVTKAVTDANGNPAQHDPFETDK